MAKSGDFEAATSPAALQTAIMEILAILKVQTDAAAVSSKTCRFL
jgi:hypothetical protein